MKCSSCGSINDVSSKFCFNCGKDLSVKNENLNEVKKESKVSLIIGIVCICLSLIYLLNIIVFPLAIVGLVFAIKHFKEGKKNKIGLALNIISYVISIAILIVVSLMISYFTKPINKFVGTWDCSSFDGSSVGNSNNIVTFIINRNETFTWGKYNDLDNNYVKGKYVFTDLHKTNYGKNATYYNFKLNGERYVINGVTQNEKYSSEYEVGYVKDNGTGEFGLIMLNNKTYNMYWCEKR